MNCPDLRRVHAHLSQGTRPTDKMVKVTSVKRYLCKDTISKDGLLVARHSEIFLPEKEFIVVPQNVLPGIITSLHLRFNHPSPTQLRKLFHRRFYTLNADACVSSVCTACSQCQSLRTIPKQLHKQSSSTPPTIPCTGFACDVMQHYKQYIFILRDTFSSFTVTLLLSDEEHDTLRTALISSISGLHPNPQTKVVVQVDNAPGFQALKNDNHLQQLYIELDFGRIKNENKNPVAEKAVREVAIEILRYDPEAGPMTVDSLALITSQQNSHIRNPGLLAWEILHQQNH